MSELNVIQPDPKRLKKIKSILVTQAAPTDAKSPYFDIEKKYSIKVDFRSFIEVKGVAYKEFRKQKINILEHTAIIFTSRNAIDHFFRICKEAKIETPTDMKYFCITEQTANYLQKYIVIRKRKVFTGTKTALDLLEDDFEVWVVTDACASRSDRDRDAAFDRLAGAGAELLTTEMVLFEWLRSAENPDFKQVQTWIKALV